MVKRIKDYHAEEPWTKRRAWVSVRPARLFTNILCHGMLLLSLAAISSAQSVTFTAYPIPGSDANYITVGPDGALWFTEVAANKIGRITTEGLVKEFAIPTPNSGPMGLTAASDGAVWFVEFGGNKIGRITVAGAINEYAIPTPISGPLGITAGPDGALWFTEMRANNIGRITTTGAITEYACPTHGCSPYGITDGPDGAIWFVEYGGNKIGRITVGGAITEYALTTGLSAPNFIATGPGGALWFTQYGGRIGQITTAGIVTSYALNLSTRGANALGVTMGPDGALWFTESGNAGISSDKIGRITLAGAVSEYTLLTENTASYAITLGPDGALWCTGRTNRIGRAALVFPTPSIAAVRNGADAYLETIQSNSWVTIYGSNLASPSSSRTWSDRDIIGGTLPLSLDGIGVTINGKRAPVEYISPTQINVLAPDDSATGPINVVVTNVSAPSAAFSAQLQTYSPAFFTLPPPNQRYVAAVFPPGPDATSVYVAPSGALGAGVSARPARAGDVVELFATGLGPTDPTPPDGRVFFGAYPTAEPVTVTIGGIEATVSWAGLSSVGLYQLNVTVPAGLPNGDAPLVAVVGGVQSQSSTVIVQGVLAGIFIPVQQ